MPQDVRREVARLRQYNDHLCDALEAAQAAQGLGPAVGGQHSGGGEWFGGWRFRLAGAVAVSWRSGTGRLSGRTATCLGTATGVPALRVSRLGGVVVAVVPALRCLFCTLFPAQKQEWFPSLASWYVYPRFDVHFWTVESLPHRASGVLAGVGRGDHRGSEGTAVGCAGRSRPAGGAAGTPWLRSSQAGRPPIWPAWLLSDGWYFLSQMRTSSGMKKN